MITKCSLLLLVLTVLLRIGTTQMVSKERNGEESVTDVLTAFRKHLVQSHMELETLIIQELKKKGITIDVNQLRNMAESSAKSSVNDEFSPLPLDKPMHAEPTGVEDDAHHGNPSLKPLHVAIPEPISSEADGARDDEIPPIIRHHTPRRSFSKPGP